MQYLTKIIVVIPLLIICFQAYLFSTSRKGVERQERCRALGIAYMAIGIVALVFRDAVIVLAGLVMMMMGLRLIAHGLDRIDKKVFIDRYDEDR